MAEAKIQPKISMDMNLLKKYWIPSLISIILFSIIFTLSISNSHNKRDLKEKEVAFKTAQNSINELQKQRAELIIKAVKFQIKADSSEALAIRYSKNQLKTKVEYEKIINSVDSFTDDDIFYFWAKHH